MVISKKSTFPVLSSLNLMKIIKSWVFAKFHEDRTKNVVFFLMANIWMCLIFYSSDFIAKKISYHAKISTWSCKNHFWHPNNPRLGMSLKQWKYQKIATISFLSFLLKALLHKDSFFKKKTLKHWRKICQSHKTFIYQIDSLESSLPW